MEFLHFVHMFHSKLMLTSNVATFLAVSRMTNAGLFDPRHDKTNKVTVRPAKTQISLGIRPVWSVFVATH